MFGGKKDQTTIKRKTKIKQTHTSHDPNLNLLGNNPIQGPHMVQPGMTGKRASSSSSSSSDEARRRQQQTGFTNQPVGLSTGMMGPTTMGTTGLSSQGYSQGMQNYPNTGITGQGTMPSSQYGGLQTGQTMPQGETKISTTQKIKEKLHLGK